MKNIILFLIIIIVFPAYIQAEIWKVGPGRQYSKPSAVSGLVKDGDTVEMDEATYVKDVTRWTKHNLVLRGTGAGARLDAGQTAYGRKAVWVISGNNTLVENIEFFGCRDPKQIDQNWAGIRQEGKGLHVRNCYFHDNDNGILGGGGAESDIIIEYSEFAYNGFGDGYSHNLYIGNVKSLTFSYNYSHHARVGHELKSRAMRNYILYNRIGNESDGTASREIDLPNGGLAILIGNQIQQGINTSNSGMIGYGLEGLSNPVPHKVYVYNNTIVNSIQGQGLFIDIMNGTELFHSVNNIFAGYGETLKGSATVVKTMNNVVKTDIAAAGFVNYIEYDYHLVSTSSAVDFGVAPGKTDDGFDLTPLYEYSHPGNKKDRSIDNSVDAGAYEYNSPVNSNKVILKSSPGEFNVIAFPNPFKNKVSFQIESNISGNGVLSLYNLWGEKIKILYEGTFYADERKTVDFIPTEFFHNGIVYVLDINGTRYYGKLVCIQ